MQAIATATTIGREFLTDTLWRELEPLFFACRESATPDRPMVLSRDRLPPMTWWVAREGGAPVGYCCHIIHDHPFYAERWAQCASFYVEPTSPTMPFRLLRHIERDLRDMDVDRVIYGAPHLSQAGVFFEANGYDCLELVMGKML